ncbi:MAG: FtsX-like permease family protein [Candidatus Acidiferrum sp.]
MMATLRTGNRAMFWRIIRRLLGANRGRLFVILLALGAGAAVTAALLNLQVDAKRRLTTEFRAFGPNLIIGPRDAGGPDGAPRSIDESVLKQLGEPKEGTSLAYAAFLYGVVEITTSPGRGNGPPAKITKAILAGYFHLPLGSSSVVPATLVDAEEKTGFVSSRHCEVGQKVATLLQLRSGDGIELTNGSRKDACAVYPLASTGGPEDSQVFLDLPSAQALLAQAGRLSLIQIRVSGTPSQIQSYADSLQQRLSGTEVRPIRQFTEGEAKIYGRIRGLLTATVSVVLLLTGLCVMAAMTNVAMERKNDVGLMKAIGGATRRVLRLFLAEAALLGFAGGVIGAAIGIFLSIWLGKQVFGVAAEPRLIVYPIAVGLTTLVAILSAYPLRRLASVRPASVFRGEG